MQDIDGWFELHTIRNQLAHDYEDDNEELVAIINKIFTQKTKLERYFFTITQKLGDIV